MNTVKEIAGTVINNNNEIQKDIQASESYRKSHDFTNDHFADEEIPIGRLFMGSFGCVRSENCNNIVNVGRSEDGFNKSSYSLRSKATELSLNRKDKSCNYQQSNTKDSTVSSKHSFPSTQYEETPTNVPRVGRLRRRPSHRTRGANKRSLSSEFRSSAESISGLKTDNNSNNTNDNALNNSVEKKTPPANVPPQQLPPAHVPPQQLPPAHVPPQQLPPAHVSPQQLTPAHVPPQQLPPAHVSPQQLTPANVPPQQLQPAHVPPQQLPSAHVPPQQFPSAHLLASSELSSDNSLQKQQENNIPTLECQYENSYSSNTIYELSIQSDLAVVLRNVSCDTESNFDRRSTSDLLSLFSVRIIDRSKNNINEKLCSKNIKPIYEKNSRTSAERIENKKVTNANIENVVKGSSSGSHNPQPNIEPIINIILPVCNDPVDTSCVHINTSTVNEVVYQQISQPVRCNLHPVSRLDDINLINNNPTDKLVNDYHVELNNSKTIDQIHQHETHINLRKENLLRKEKLVKQSQNHLKDVNISLKKSNSFVENKNVINNLTMNLRNRKSNHINNAKCKAGQKDTLSLIGRSLNKITHNSLSQCLEEVKENIDPEYWRLKNKIKTPKKYSIEKVRRSARIKKNLPEKSLANSSSCHTKSSVVSHKSPIKNIPSDQIYQLRRTHKLLINVNKTDLIKECINDLNHNTAIICDQGKIIDDSSSLSTTSITDVEKYNISNDCAVILSPIDRIIEQHCKDINNDSILYEESCVNDSDRDEVIEKEDEDLAVNNSKTSEFQNKKIAESEAIGETNFISPLKPTEPRKLFKKSITSKSKSSNIMKTSFNTKGNKIKALNKLRQLNKQDYEEESDVEKSDLASDNARSNITNNNTPYRLTLNFRGDDSDSEEEELMLIASARRKVSLPTLLQDDEIEEHEWKINKSHSEKRKFLVMDD